MSVTVPSAIKYLDSDSCEAKVYTMSTWTLELQTPMIPS